MDDASLPDHPMVPQHTRWERRELFGFEDPRSVPYQLYQGDRAMGLFVTSEYEPRGPTWHLAVSAMWRRARDDEVAVILQDFGAEAFEEVPTRRSLIRHFVWPPCCDKPDS